MAFTIKGIKALLSENELPVENLDKAAEEICSRHNATMESIKEERDGYRKDAETLADTKKALETAQAELKRLQEQPDDGYREKYEKEHQAFEDFKAAAQEEKLLAAKKSAYTELCKDAGLSEKGVAKAVKYADWKSVELDDDGSIKNANDHIRGLKEEWAEHVVKTTVEGANTPTPPGTSGGGYKSKDDILNIKDDAERQKAIAENHELFGF